MDEIATPHDTYFRESFGRREVALDFLRMQLPTDLLAEIELDSLEIAKDSYVSTELRTAFSDLVYRVRCRSGALSIYLLFEHKAAPEHWVDEPDVRHLLQQTATGDPIMQIFIDRYIEQGREQGMEQGRQEGEAVLLLRLIEHRFGPPSPAVRARVMSADARTLSTWFERALSAESVDAALH